MSISTTMSNINRIQKEIANLEKQLSAEQRKEALLSGKISQLERSITRASSLNTLNSKMLEISRHKNDISRCNSKKADINKKIATKTADLHRYKLQLDKEQGNEQKKRITAQKKIEKEQLEHQKKITRELESQKRAISSSNNFNRQIINKSDETEDIIESYDVFISHATEDKDSFVRPLAELLKAKGINVWYDEFSLGWGKSLRKTIDYGLANSRFGIVVLSKSFIKKDWTEYELNGLTAREMSGEDQVILPIWHEVSKSDILKFSPTLVDKMALNTSINTIDEIAEQLELLL
ncbi:TIR domain-containing protein, partial [Escherichia coli]|nr:TIR domain-containing protein [Escherichia coli]